MRARFALVLVSVALASAACSGNGCSQLGKTPGGYPPDDRQPGAIQVRATDAFFEFMNTNGAAIIPALLPTGSSFNIPPQCSGNTKICCTNPATDCTLNLDFREVLLVPSAPDVIKLTARFALKTAMPLPVGLSLGVSANCMAAIDTAPGSLSDLTLTADLRFEVTSRQTTRIVLDNPDLGGLEPADLDLNAPGSDALCGIATTDFVKNIAIGLIVDQFKTQIAGAVDGQQCTKCTTLDDCNGYAAMCDGGLCKDGNGQCIESLGIEGRLNLGALLGSIAPNLKGALDIYAVAGGYAETDTGASLGLLGGGKAAAHSQCVPQLTPPPPTPIPPSDTFRANQVEGAPADYHLAIGVHQQFLERAFFGTFDAGGLCLAIGTITQPLLSANALAVIMPSLSQLLGGQNAPLYLTTRPTAAPQLTLRRGLYETDAMTGQKKLVEPLIDIVMPGFELDFYALIAERYVRIFTVRSDVKLGIGLDVDADGKLVPILGDLSSAFTNLVISNTELLTETPTDLAAVFPTLLNLAVGQIADALKPIALPALGGLTITPRAVISTDPEAATPDDAPRKFLAIFADLSASMARIRSAETKAHVVSVLLPEKREFAVTARGATSPSVLVALDDGGKGGLEWSYRLDGGFWSAYSSSTSLTITDAKLWLIGDHQLEIRARGIGAPRTADRTPLVLTVPIQPFDASDDQAGFHGRSHEPASSSCGGCAASGDDASTGGALLLVAIVGVLLQRRRACVALFVVLPLSVLSLGCKDKGVTDADRLSALDIIGREHASIGADDGIHIAAYDQTVGDLAYAKQVPSSTQPIDWLYVDGIAANAPKDPMAVRRHGVTDPGPDVGRYPAIAVKRDKTPMIAYYDATARALKFAVGPFPFTTHTIAAPSGAEDLGRYATVALTVPDEKPVVSFLATNLPADNNGFRSELRVARANVSNPKSASDWSITTVDEARIPCGGLCGSRVCLSPLVDGQPDPDPTTSFCTDASTDCDPACATGTACIAGACRATVSALPGDLVEGIALFSSVAQTATGQLSIAYYDRSRGALRLASELDSGGFATQYLDGEAAGADVGAFPAMAIDPQAALHIVYVDAIDDRLLYRKVQNKVAVGSPEVVDDGVRQDGLHPVGGSAAIHVAQSSTLNKLYAYYQDQRDLSIVEASRDLGATVWTQKTLTTPTGVESYGFAIRHVTVLGKRYLTHYLIDRSQVPTFGTVRVLPLAD